MTTTARIEATTSASTAYTASVATGVTATFGGHDMSSNDPPIIFESKDAAGTYRAMTVLNNRGYSMRVELRRSNNTITLNGPLDFRINKPATTLAVEVSEDT